MHDTSDDSLRAAHTDGGQRGRRPRPAVIAAAAALLAAAGVAGCSGPALTPAPGGSVSSPAASAAVHSSAAVPVPLSWSAARAPLPADTSGVSGQYTSLVDVSCPDVGSCVAVGSDKASAAGGDVYQGLIDTLSHGTWTPTSVPDVSSDTSKGFATLNGVSCPAPGTCAAVGFFDSAPGVLTPVIERLSGGHWEPVKPPLPDDAVTTESATLTDVMCPATGTCVATGWYSTQGGVHDVYVDALADGTWTAASVPLPGDAAPESVSTAGASTILAGVACPGVGTCVTMGQYRDDSGQIEPFIDTLSGGTWTAASAPLPGDRAATGQIAALWAIACPAPGACIAAGHYMVHGGQPRFLTEKQSGGTWTAAAIPLPADAAADQKWSQDGATAIAGLACESVGACVATADYVDHANEILPLIETLSGGTWTAVQAPLPADAVPGTGAANAPILQLATCPAVGHCLTVGSYPAADGTVESLIETAAPR